MIRAAASIEPTPGWPSSSTLFPQAPDSLADSRPRKRHRQSETMITEAEDPNISSRSFRSNGSTMAGHLSSGPIESSITRRGASNLAINGTSKVPTNGSASAKNGKPINLPYFGHDREEVTRILIQTLEDLGYSEAAAVVSRDSGYSLENRDVAAFRTAISTGAWEEAEELLFGAQAADTGSELSDIGIVLVPGADTNLMRFWMRQQKFLELLEKRDNNTALQVLRSELTPLCQDTPRLHFLSSLLMCRTAQEVRERATWDGADGDSRHVLLSRLSSKSIAPVTKFRIRFAWL